MITGTHTTASMLFQNVVMTMAAAAPHALNVRFRIISRDAVKGGFHKRRGKKWIAVRAAARPESMTEVGQVSGTASVWHVSQCRATQSPAVVNK